MSQPRILHVIPSFEWGGTERSVINLSEQFIHRKATIAVVCLGSEGPVKDELDKLGVKTLALNLKHRPARGLISLITFVKKFRPTILMGWLYHSSLICSLVLKHFVGTSVRVVWNMRSMYHISNRNFLLKIAQHFCKLLSHQPDHIIYNSQTGKRDHESVGFCPRQSLVIPNGINVEKFSFSEGKREMIRRSLNIPRDALVIGMIARWDPEKNHLNFLQATAELSPDPARKVYYVLAGRNVDNNNASIQRIISQTPDAGRNYILLGERRDIEDIMSSIDLLVLPSMSEGFPNVIAEALACGTFCIGSDVGDTKGIIDQFGKVFPPGDVESLKSALDKWIQDPFNACSSKREKAAAYIKQNFSLQAIADRFWSLMVFAHR